MHTDGVRAIKHRKGEGLAKESGNKNCRERQAVTKKRPREKRNICF
jgi:hypothetical protein